LGWLTLSDNDSFKIYATEFTRQFPRAGFHNEFITNSVKSGILGLISSVLLLAVPLYFSSKFILIKNNYELKIISTIFIITIIHLFITGLSTEITNLVFLSSFLGLTIAVYAGNLIYLNEKL